MEVRDNEISGRRKSCNTSYIKETAFCNERVQSNDYTTDEKILYQDKHC